jgi:hypothetical protein
MNRPGEMNKLEEAHQSYLEQRAQDKYDGKLDGPFPLKEFRECADYLGGVLQNATLDSEDIGDVVRVALSKREKLLAPEPGEKGVVVR